MELVFDIETNGWNPDKVNCMVVKELGKDPILFRPDENRVGINLLLQAYVLIGHNILGFDIPVINKLYNTNVGEDSTIIDTLVLSRLFDPVREGGHSLKNWGYIVGSPKGEEPEEWEYFTEDMLIYCKQDVVLNELIYNHQNQKESKGFSEEAIVLEHDVFKIIKQQEDNGFYFNTRQASMLVAELKEKMTKVQREVRSTFKTKWVDVKKVFPKFKKDGELSKS